MYRGRVSKEYQDKGYAYVLPYRHKWDRICLIREIHDGELNKRKTGKLYSIGRGTGSNGNY